MAALFACRPASGTCRLIPARVPGRCGAVPAACSGNVVAQLESRL